MSFLDNLFSTPRPPPRPENAWFPAGLVSSFPNITTSDDTVLSSFLPCTTPKSTNTNTSSESNSTTISEEANIANSKSQIRACKIFHVSPANEIVKAVEIDLKDLDDIKDLSGQVMVFLYQEKFFAVDHRCPHSSFPLSNGTPFDIEDFGVVLSRGIRCPKHEWSFDLFRGGADRGGYRLGVWEVELRSEVGGGGGGGGEGDREVWVRRKQRMG